MFFNKTFSEIEYEDVVSFCAQQIKENEVLDYKENFPSKLEKVISAFANTYGGLIIIGVPDEDGKPIKNPVGINFEKGLEERVQSIVVSNIKPAIFPIIHVCTPVAGKTFVLIQVSQSSNTPHSIENNTKVYIRTGLITTPEKLVDIDNELHWLMRNRQDSVYLRNNLISAMFDKFTALQKLTKTEIEFAELSIFCIPIYPSNPIFDPLILKTKLNDIFITIEGGYRYPSIDKSSIETLPGGIYLYFNNKNSWGEFTEFTAINNDGLVYQVEDSGHCAKEGEITRKSIYLSQVIGTYIKLLKFYRKFQANMLVMGDYRLKVSLTKIYEVNIIPISVQGTFDKKPKISSDKCFNFSRIVTMEDISNVEKLNALLEHFIADLHWGLGVPIEDVVIKKWVADLKFTW